MPNNSAHYCKIEWDSLASYVCSLRNSPYLMAHLVL